jgi:hypothetical protein
MTNPALGQQIKAFLLVGAGLVIAVLLGFNIGNENYGVMILGALLVIGAGIALFSGSYLWVMAVASSFLGGTFPVLGGSFTPFHILMAMGVARFAVEDLVLRRTAIRAPNRSDLLLITGFMFIITAHALHHRFGMRFLGSSVWGGRNYVNVYVGLAAFFILLSTKMDMKVWRKLPYFVLGVTAFDLTIALITTVFPSSIYKIFPFYSAVSTSGIAEILTGQPVETARVGGFGTFGFVLVLIVLAKISVRQIVAPGNFSRLFLLFVGGIAVLISSFRSSLIDVLLAFFAAAIRDLRWGVLAVLPLVALLLFGLSFVNSEVVRLPKTMQRSLSFVPGEWDAEMARDASASNDFRQRLWTVFTKEYFPAHPWFGRGFGFRSEFGRASVYKNNPNWDREAVEVGNVHNGLLATIDAVGIVGALFFIAWNIRLLIQTFRVKSRAGGPLGLPLRFVALYLAVSIFSYWFGAQSVGSFLPQEFVLAALFLRLHREIETAAVLPEPHSLRQPSSAVPRVAVA